MKLENRRTTLHNLLDLMKEIVYDEIASQPTITRVQLTDRLGLKIASYPQEAVTQAETSWLTSILVRKLQDEGRVFYKMLSDTRVSYSTTPF